MCIHHYLSISTDLWSSKPQKFMLNQTNHQPTRLKVATAPASRSSWRRLGIGCSRCSNFTLALSMREGRHQVPFWIILGGRINPRYRIICQLGFWTLLNWFSAPARWGVQPIWKICLSFGISIIIIITIITSVIWHGLKLNNINQNANHHPTTSPSNTRFVGHMPPFSLAILCWNKILHCYIMLSPSKNTTHK